MLETETGISFLIFLRPLCLYKKLLLDYSANTQGSGRRSIQKIDPSKKNDYKFRKT